ncbi:MAG: T9SS type A sorting domain-containing protein [Bacteroidales bacterium]|nr:T9SS type A sorting domain-containing protein [Bacteroidales bacterium]
MNYKVLLVIFLIMCYTSSGQAPIISIPDGYAGSSATTGGGTATPVTISTESDFKSAVDNDNPAVIYVDGLLNVGDVSIGSNKTIVGLTTSSGLTGGRVSVQGTNYIFKNLTFGPASADVMELSGATKVFITKCSFHDAGDELLSIVRETDYVTVSWCKFYFDNSHDHAFGHLIGNRDDRTTDRGKLHVTMHHNWYAHGIRGRQPRVRYGHVHIYNNYYNSVGSDYCIGTGYECHIRLENTHFESVSDPWEEQNIGALTSGGEIGWSNLKFTGCSQPNYIPNSYPVFSLPYNYNMYPVDSVKDIVKECAGNVFCDLQNTPAVIITSPLDNSVFQENSNITINANASVNNGKIANVEFYNDTLLVEDISTPYSYIWENVPSGIYSLSASATDTNNVTGMSDIVKIYVGSGVAITAPADSSEFNEHANITITAHAWDGGGSISSLEFFSDTISLGIDNSEPYSATWNDLPSGSYILTAKARDNENNIFSSDVVSINVISSPVGYAFSSVKAEDIIIYPNPTLGELTINLNEVSSGIAYIHIYNSYGELLMNEKLTGRSHELSIRELPSGIYIIFLATQEGNTVRKIIKN